MRHLGHMATLFQSVSRPSEIWPLQCRCMRGHHLPMNLRNWAKLLSLGFQAIQDQYRMDFTPWDILVKWQHCFSLFYVHCLKFGQGRVTTCLWTLGNVAKLLSPGYHAIQDQYRMDFATWDILVKWQHCFSLFHVPPKFGRCSAGVCRVTSYQWTSGNAENLLSLGYQALTINPRVGRFPVDFLWVNTV